LTLLQPEAKIASDIIKIGVDWLMPESLPSCQPELFPYPHNVLKSCKFAANQKVIIEKQGTEIRIRTYVLHGDPIKQARGILKGKGVSVRQYISEKRREKKIEE
jgi:hypothetical protein